jgi:hypothetical protein
LCMVSPFIVLRLRIANAFSVHLRPLGERERWGLIKL